MKYFGDINVFQVFDLYLTTILPKQDGDNRCNLLGKDKGGLDKGGLP